MGAGNIPMSYWDLTAHVSGKKGSGTAHIKEPESVVFIVLTICRGGEKTSGMKFSKP